MPEQRVLVTVPPPRLFDGSRRPKFLAESQRRADSLTRELPRLDRQQRASSLTPRDVPRSITAAASVALAKPHGEQAAAVARSATGQGLWRDVCEWPRDLSA